MSLITRLLNPSVMMGTRPGDGAIAESVNVLNGKAGVIDYSVRPHEDDQLALSIAGLVVEPVVWKPTDDGVIVPGRCAVLGFRVLAGTTPTLDLYDGEDTTGIPIFKGVATLTVGKFYPIMGGEDASAAAAVLCATGLYGNQGGTTPEFLFFVARSRP